MAAIVRLEKKGLIELIETIKDNGGDSTEFEKLLSEVNGDEDNQRPVRRMGNPLRILVEEPTTEERLEVEVGELFPEGITGEVLTKCIEMDSKYTLAELKKMCIEAGLSPSGHKKALAAKLIAKEGEMMEEQANLLEQNQWEAGPDEELKIPEVYITRLRYEIVILAQKKDFTFRCSEYEQIPSGAWHFANVIIDTSKLNSRGEVELKRVTYHPEIELVNVPFMSIPAPEGITPGEAD